MFKNSLRWKILVLSCVLSLAACGGAEDDAASKAGSSEAGASQASALGAIWADESPSDPLSVLAIREDATVGDAVAVTGRVQGFVERRAFINLTDMALKSCLPEDGAECSCDTPWDYCCVEPQELTRHTIAVEFRDDEGKLFKMGLKGFKGLDHLQTVVVTGKVKTRDDKGNVTVVGTSISRD